IRNVILRQTMPRGFKEFGLDVDCHNVVRTFGDLQGEPAIARAKVNDLHIGRDPHSGHDLVRSWPQSLPPTRCRHFGGVKEAWGMSGHLRDGLDESKSSILHSTGTPVGTYVGQYHGAGFTPASHRASCA